MGFKNLTKYFFAWNFLHILLYGFLVWSKVNRTPITAFSLVSNLGPDPLETEVFHLLL